MNLDEAIAAAATRRSQRAEQRRIAIEEEKKQRLTDYHLEARNTFGDAFRWLEDNTSVTSRYAPYSSTTDMTPAVAIDIDGRELLLFKTGSGDDWSLGYRTELNPQVRVHASAEVDSDKNITGDNLFLAIGAIRSELQIERALKYDK